MTWYDVLGVDAKATPEALKHAYHLRLQLLHPDHHVGAPAEVIAAAEAATTEVNQAWAILSNPVSRRRYDEGRGFEPPSSRPQPERRPPSPWRRTLNLVDPPASNFVIRV